MSSGLNSVKSTQNAFILLSKQQYSISDFAKAQTAQSSIGKVMSCPPATENGLIHLLAQNREEEEMATASDPSPWGTIWGHGEEYQE